jgi:hypothetical protein
LIVDEIQKIDEAIQRALAGTAGDSTIADKAGFTEIE